MHETTMATADFSFPTPGHLSNMFMNDLPSIDDLMDLYTDEDMLLPDCGDDSFQPIMTFCEPPKPLAAAPVSPDVASMKTVQLMTQAAPIAPQPTIFPRMVLPPPMLGVQNVFYAPPSMPLLQKTPLLMKPTTTPTSTKKIEKEGAPKTKKNTTKRPVEKSSTASQPRKRRRTSGSGGAPVRVYTEKQRVERRERNRQHAKKSRSRKKSLTENLRQSLDEIRKENEKLRTELYKKFGEDEIKALVEKKTASPAEQFVMALQKSENKVVDDKTRDFLKELAKKVPSKKLQN